MLGIELRDSTMVIVDVDDAGLVRSRMDVPAGADSGAAALDALAAMSPGDGVTLGVAAPAPSSDAAARLCRALATRHSGRFVAEGPMPSGSAAAYAEATVGAGRGARHVALLTVDAHAIGGIVRDGVVFTGARGRAAAVGWLALNPVEREDYRKAGCLEAEVAAAGIVRRLVWRVKAGDRSRVTDAVGGDLQAIRVGHVLDAARDHDGVALSVVRDTAKYLGMAAANLVVIVDPDVLVVGGIMASAADLLLEPLRVEIARRVPPQVMEALSIVTAALGDDAAAIGVARLEAAKRP